ncbi:MAG TPA: PilZ domain-containing protein [Desulfobacteraceae bacterium]|nr:PilZ domain-containing protein [Desulfobacteraceae bacterium]
MKGESRSAKRYSRFLPIDVVAMDSDCNEVLAGPFPGRIINISRHGACLLMSRVILNSFHLFYSTKEKENSCIQLTINIQPEIINCKITGQPVWMDIFREGDIRAFKMGIEFVGDADNEEMAHLEQVVSKR